MRVAILKGSTVENVIEVVDEATAIRVARTYPDDFDLEILDDETHCEPGSMKLDDGTFTRAPEGFVP